MSSGGNLIYHREEGTFIDNKKCLRWYGSPSSSVQTEEAIRP
jgi:hypothetical protein